MPTQINPPSRVAAVEHLRRSRIPSLASDGQAPSSTSGQPKINADPVISPSVSAIQQGVPSNVRGHTIPAAVKWINAPWRTDARAALVISFAVAAVSRIRRGLRRLWRMGEARARGPGGPGGDGMPERQPDAFQMRPSLPEHGEGARSNRRCSPYTIRVRLKAQTSLVTRSWSSPQVVMSWADAQLWFVDAGDRHRTESARSAYSG